ncbi:MAG TPA: Holliday junction branch migration protein RuvA [Acholeplasma sp.]|nr:Holliday junction branch migration protein RuvA [Acholeplasma sp.]
MYNYIKGKITYIANSYIVLENNNIGYEIKSATPYDYKIDDVVTIYLYLNVREDIQELYGFKTLEEKEFFLKLISVKGLGPKSALPIIASNNISGVIEAIKEGDAKYLQKFPGIGPKASQQIILDLHGKIDIDKTIKTNPKLLDAKAALESLGYKQKEIKQVLPIIEANLDKELGELIKIALRNLI